MAKHETAGYQEWLFPPWNEERSELKDTYASFSILITEVANLNTTPPYNTES